MQESREITQKPKLSKNASMNEEPPALVQQQSSYRSIPDEREKYDVHPLTMNSNNEIMEPEN